MAKRAKQRAAEDIRAVLRQLGVDDPELVDTIMVTINAYLSEAYKNGWSAGLSKGGYPKKTAE